MQALERGAVHLNAPNKSNSLEMLVGERNVANDSPTSASLLLLTQCRWVSVRCPGCSQVEKYTFVFTTTARYSEVYYGGSEKASQK